MDRQMDGRSDGWTDRRTGGQTDATKRIISPALQSIIIGIESVTVLCVNLHSVSKETQLFFVDFSWGPGSGSWGFWQVVSVPIFIGIHYSPKERQL